MCIGGKGDKAKRGDKYVSPFFVRIPFHCRATFCCPACVNELPSEGRLINLRSYHGMNKREKRKQEKQDKKARNARLGYCHGCGAPWTKLTYEHVPPDRVQALIPEKYLRFNPFDISIDQS